MSGDMQLVVLDYSSWAHSNPHRLVDCPKIPKLNLRPIRDRKNRPASGRRRSPPLMFRVVKVLRAVIGHLGQLSPRFGMHFQSYHPHNVGPIDHGANSSSPTPLISLLVFSPLAVAKILSKISSPTFSNETPSNTLPALMSMSPIMWL